MNLESLNRKNFKYQEFFKSNTAEKLGINNIAEFTKLPTQQYASYLNNGVNLTYYLQKIRDLMNDSKSFRKIIDSNEISILITSGYRCPALNKAVGGRPTSQHTRFEAVDIRINGITEFNKLKEIAVWIKSKDLPIDQLLVEATWLHLSCKLELANNRKMFGTFIDNKFKSF